jgi:diaminohydroxyphosphoribosylaminopyrimidine deaminase/5-amino-6-(5-phosphoribosylamino)uracil reductase
VTPEQAMARALARARRASGRSFPNPPVGALVLRGDRVLGEGETRPAGGPHAEIVALAHARARHGERALRGATLAVTLEPCCHQGRTGPCTDAILSAGIRRVWVGQRDPNPRVSGGGLSRLRRAGLSLRVGVLEPECREQHRGFLSVQQRGRPWVSLKLAATLDGRIATREGESRWITGPRARAAVHRLRDAADAVMVGSGTAQSDDPELSVRRGDRRVRMPIRVLVDGGLRVSAAARLFRDEDATHTWLLTRRGHPSRRLALRTAHGTRALLVPARAGHLDLRRALALLAREGSATSGGGEAGWRGAARPAGGRAALVPGAEPARRRRQPALGALEIRDLAQRCVLDVREVRRLGPDLYVRALLSSPGGPS